MIEKTIFKRSSQIFSSLPRPEPSDSTWIHNWETHKIRCQIPSHAFPNIAKLIKKKSTDNPNYEQERDKGCILPPKGTVSLSQWSVSHLLNTLDFPIKAFKWIFSENTHFQVLFGFSAEVEGTEAQRTGLGVRASGSKSQLPDVLESWWYRLMATSWLPPSRHAIQDDAGAAPSLHTNQTTEIHVWPGHRFAGDS